MKKKDFKNLSRTQVLIINSLITLMKTDDFHKITITQIIQEAEIARGTFYLNFKTKEEVIRCFIEALIEDYDEKMSLHDTRTPYLMCLNYFEYWARHLEFAVLLKKHQLLYLLLDTYEIYINKISIKWTPEKVFNLTPFTDIETSYFSSFNAAGLWNMLLRWIETGSNETPEEMAKIYEKFILR